MQIDWLTVGAQWINFLILMWLLRRFLYRPILRAMDKRQQTIAEHSQKAQQEAKQAEQLAQEYRDKLAELEAKRAELIAIARKEADSERENLLQQARKESQNLSAKWREEIENEKATFQTQLSLELGHLVTATAKKAVQDLSSLEWEQALFGAFLGRLRQLPEQDKNRLSDSARSGLTLASSFELDETMRKALRAALTQGSSEEADIRFEALPASQAGLKLCSIGYSVSWTIEDYFAHLESDLDGLLNQSKPQADSTQFPRVGNAPT